jgi:hypothetical protein
LLFTALSRENLPGADDWKSFDSVEEIRFASRPPRTLGSR